MWINSVEEVAHRGGLIGSKRFFFFHATVARATSNLKDPGVVN